MNFLFRVDASQAIGTGHVMRCLTLADGLKENGHSCLFVCRHQKGHLGELIKTRGFDLILLPQCKLGFCSSSSLEWNRHAEWLGVHWSLDAAQVLDVIQHQKIDFLIVDHYALDSQWEKMLSTCVGGVMVIDDLADRHHSCDILLDQTYGCSESSYLELVPDNCLLLCGAEFALLRPEFSLYRPSSLQRRRSPRIKHILISMGGVDKDNITGQVLLALRDNTFLSDSRITVIMGESSPWLNDVMSKAETMPWPTQVKVGVRDMALLMTESDIAIGAAGSTSWERCCLGLPTLMVVIAENQVTIASSLCAAGAVKLIELNEIYDRLSSGSELIDESLLQSMSVSAAQVADGLGMSRVIDHLISRVKHAS